MKAILFLLLWLPLAVGCKKNEIDALPPATQTGANTFGCLVNGKAWVPQKGGLFTDKPVEGGYEGNAFGLKYCVWIQTTDKDGSGIDIYLREVDSPKEYKLNQNIVGIYPTYGNPLSYAYYRNGDGNYITTAQHIGKVTIIKADTIRGIVSGTF